MELKKLKRNFSSVFDRKLLFLLGMIVVVDVFMVTLGPPNSLDIQLYYSGAEARALWDTFTETDLNSYFINEVFDLGLIALYTSALFIALRRTYVGKAWVAFLSLIVGTCDLIETGVILSVLKFSVSQAVFEWLGVFTFLKWTLGLVAVLFLIVGLAQIEKMRLSKANIGTSD